MTTQFISPKEFAKRLSCSLSMLYRSIDEDPDFPAPAAKLFGDGKRGRRWTEEQVEEYMRLKSLRCGNLPEEDEGPAPRFVKVTLRHAQRPGEIRRVA